MWQEVIVFCIVAAAALHAATKYLPAAVRRRIVHLLVRCGADRAILFRIVPRCEYDGAAQARHQAARPALRVQGGVGPHKSLW